MCVVSFGTTAYIIDSIGLTIQPKNAVERGTPVLIGCHVSVSHSNIPDLENQFQILKDEVPIYSFNTTNSTVLYELNPARAADSGSYECRVTVKDKSKASFSERLDVTGTFLLLNCVLKMVTFDGLLCI